MAGDDHIRRPRPGRDAEELEFHRQGGRILRRFGNVGIYAAHVRGDDGFAVGVVPVQFGLQVSAEPVQACADVALQLLRPEDFRDRAGSLPAPHLKLKQPIADGGIALGEEQIAFVPGIDMVEAPPVAQDLNRFRKARHGKRRARGRRAAVQPAGGDEEDEEKEQEKNRSPHGGEC